MSARTWDFTINNYTPCDIDLLYLWSQDVNRMVASKEIGDEKQTPHLQGRVTFKRSYRMKALKKLHSTAHWEITKCRQDSLYCMKKESEVFINVDNRAQGKRTDLDLAIEDVKNGATIRDLWKNHSKAMVRYSKGIMELRRQLQEDGTTSNYEPRWPLITDWKTSHILWGAPGIGKTEYAKAHFKKALLVSHIDQLGNFDPTTHDGLIFDDMDFKHWPRTSQIHLFDQENTRAINLRYRVATIPPFTPKIFTTNEPQGAIFGEDDAIFRRVTVTEVRER